jgi:hypothetical protein
VNNSDMAQTTKVYDGQGKISTVMLKPYESRWI